MASNSRERSIVPRTIDLFGPAVAAALSVLVLAGCGPSQSSEGEPSDAEATSTFGSHPAALTSTFGTVADGWVREAKPDTNEGAAIILAAKKDVERMYFKFNVSNVGAIKSAKLRMRLHYGAAINGPRIFKASNAWTETGLTWKTQPPIGTLVADVGTLPETVPSHIEIDVTSAVSGNGEVSFQVVGDDPGIQAQFISKESSTVANRPQLLVSHEDGGVAGSGCVVRDTYSDDISELFRFPGEQHPDLLEPSGLAGSKRTAGLFYTHNEDTRTLFVYDASGMYKKFDLRLAANPLMDLEDVATGPCSPGSRSSCVWLGDLGKSSASFPSSSKTSFALHRIVEPDDSATPSGASLEVTTYPFTYSGVPGGFDAEALVVHPSTGDIYVIEKSGASGKAGVWKYPLPLDEKSKELVKVGELKIPSSSDPNAMRVTAADIHPCAPRLLVRTYRNVYEYRSRTGAFEDAFLAEPVSLPQAPEGQGESIAYGGDGGAYYTQSEETGASKGNRVVRKVSAH